VMRVLSNSARERTRQPAAPRFLSTMSSLVRVPSLLSMRCSNGGGTSGCASSMSMLPTSLHVFFKSTTAVVVVLVEEEEEEDDDDVEERQSGGEKKHDDEAAALD
jgi:hypothetical protein